MPSSPLSTKDVRSYLNDGKSISIATENFNLYNKSGDLKADDVGSHWMTITGVTKDGRYIISSWGDKYYIDPSELESSRYLVVDINP